LVAQQGGAGGLVAHLLGRAAHVDIDDLGPVVTVPAGGIGHHLGITTGDLHRAGAGFAAVVQTLAGLAAVPQACVAGDHLGDDQPGTKLPAHAAERTIRNAGHGARIARLVTWWGPILITAGLSLYSAVNGACPRTAGMFGLGQKK